MMLKFLIFFGLLLQLHTGFAKDTSGFYNLEATTNEGANYSFASLKGKVVLIANTASGCGYTPQYKNLQALNEKYSSKGLVILGFPSNDFGGQEPGTDKEIKKFCELNYKVGFQLFAKQPVSGPKIQKVFKWLIENSPQETSGPVGWNFEKFIISKNGRLIKRFRSDISPEDPALVAVIESELKQLAVDGSQKQETTQK